MNGHLATRSATGRAARAGLHIIRRDTRQEGVVAETPIGKAVHNLWWTLVIRGVLAIAVGILILVRPLASLAAFALIIALWALAQGIATVVHAFQLRPIAPHWWVALLSGLISAAFGAAALYYYPVLSLTFAVVWAAWWLMLVGILGIWSAIQERRVAMPWGWTMTLGIFGVVASIAAFSSPPATLAALMGLLSAFAIVGGIVLLMGAYRLRNGADDVVAAVHRASPV
jgi:uncharacterized membrane protein HdeD (DUF308 family)